MRGVSRWAQFPELVWLDKNDKIPPILLLSTCFALDGTTGLLWGFVLPTVVAQPAHITYDLLDLRSLW